MKGAGGGWDWLVGMLGDDVWDDMWAGTGSVLVGKCFKNYKMGARVRTGIGVGM